MEQSSPHIPNAFSHDRKLGLIVASIALLCFYNLYETASETGNWKGAWFTVAHITMLGVAVFLSLREAR
jgi:hypothetical protein